MLIYHDKSIIPYTQQEIERWINDINEMGFPCSFTSERHSESDSQLQFVTKTIYSATHEFACQMLCHGLEKPKNEDDKYYYFEVRINDFEYKSHFVSTLMLIRCLLETYICKVPEIYFQMMDANPDQNKFEALQNAHKHMGEYGVDGYHNTNHMITYKGNGKNVTPQKLYERYKACNFKVMDGEQGKGHRTLGQSTKWNGD